MKKLVVAMALTLGFAVGTAGAQNRASPAQVSLDRVELLTAQGRIMAARDALEAWLELMEPSASREEMQRAIWLRGRLTVDPSMAEADFRRLVLEYPGGPYSDDALWRLGLSAAARGDSAHAQDLLVSLARDYPRSPFAGKAEEWVRTHAGEAAIVAAVEAGAAAPPPVLPPKEDGGSFSVQLGAFRSLDLARGLAEKLQAAGYRPRLVRTPGNDLSRVRIGRFSSKEGAEARARELEALGFEVTLVSDAGLERPISFVPVDVGRNPPGRPEP